jgi:hypothetical protein
MFSCGTLVNIQGVKWTGKLYICIKKIIE